MAHWRGSLDEHTFSHPSLSWLSIARAAAITLLLAIWTLQALPSKPFDEERLAIPENQRTLGQIARALGMVGITRSVAEVQEILIGSTQALVDAREALLDPFDPVLEALEMRQRWGLFLAKSRDTHRIVIEARTERGEFEPIYVPHEVDSFGLSPLLTFRRMRAIYNPRSRTDARPPYDGLVRWLGSAILARDPSLYEVRVRLERVRVGTESRPPKSLGFDHERLHTREAT